MGKKFRSGWGMLSLVAVFSLIFATLPATGQTSSGERVLRLHLAADGDYWQWDGATPVVKQNITAAGNCLINQPSSPTLVSLQTSPANRAGMKDHSIGVKSGGSTGVPCSRIDGSETITITLAGDLADNAMTSAELDLELKKNAVVTATFLNNGVVIVGAPVLEVRSGTSVIGTINDTTAPFSAISTAGDVSDNCGGSSDSGPDSGPSDNCRWTIEPGVEFDAVRLEATVGEASLEGGGDFGTNPVNDSLFFLKFNGTLGCGDEISVSDGVLTGTFTRLEEGTCLQDKPWAINLDQTLGPNGEIEFLIDSTFTEDAEYVGVLTFAPHAAANPVNELFQWDLEDFFVNPDVGLQDAEWCESATFAGGILTGAVPPDGFHGCIARQQNQTVGSGGEVQTTWWVYFLYDLKTRG